jgi:hypothetical protein
MNVESMALVAPWNPGHQDKTMQPFIAPPCDRNTTKGKNGTTTQGRTLSSSL